MDIKPEEKQEILETIDLAARMDKVSQLLGRAPRGAAAVARDRRSRPRRRFDERQREALLREQMATIQRQLGEGDGTAREVAELSEAIAKAGMPAGGREPGAQGTAPAASACRRPPPKHGMVRTYLDWLIELPWALPPENADRHRRGAAHPRRGPLRPGEDQAADPRISRGAQAGAAGQGADPVLRRPARRRQDLARPVDRRARWAASSSASASAACTTRPRSAATAAPISARCPATSSRRSARPARATA